MKKKYKMVSICYTNDCAKKPRCSFCYLKRQKVLDGLREKKGKPFDSWQHGKLIAKAEQIAIGYNGIGLDKLVEILSHCSYPEGKPILNITTNPQFLTKHIVALFKRCRVKMIALSLDPEKCGVQEWIKKANLIRKKKIKVSANILMLDEMFSRLPDILKKISKYCYQIHLLRPKFYKTQIPLEKRKEMIFLLKQQYKNLFIDQCFRFELQGIPCTRGKDFVSINADNSVTFCSFDLIGENKKNLKKCPYI